MNLREIFVSSRLSVLFASVIQLRLPKTDQGKEHLAQPFVFKLRVPGDDTGLVQEFKLESSVLTIQPQETAKVNRPSHPRRASCRTHRSCSTSITWERTCPPYLSKQSASCPTSKSNLAIHSSKARCTLNTPTLRLSPCTKSRNYPSSSKYCRRMTAGRY